MIILTPDYGRDYKSKREVARSLLADEDFILQDCRSQCDGKPINLPQIDDAEVQVRSRDLRKVWALPTDRGKLERIANPPARKQRALWTEAERMAVEPLIRMRVDRLHVADGDVELARAIARIVRRVHPDDRLWVEWYAAQCHEHNRRVYQSVMRAM